MRYAQFLEMIQTGCLPFGGFGAGFGQGEEFAFVFDPGIGGDAEVAVVQFVLSTSKAVSYVSQKH